MTKPAQISKEATERKARSIALLKRERIPTIDHLPAIGDSSETRNRTKEEVARRAIALCIAAVKGEGLDQPTIESLIKKFTALDCFSPQEAAFIQNPHPTSQERIQFAWRYECYWVLLWALSYIETLDRPKGICDVAKAVTILRDRGTVRFIAEAKLRPLTEILDQTDVIYRYHWAVVNARLKGEPIPSGLEPGVVQERHYVLNWLIGYMDQQWDQISTDT